MTSRSATLSTRTIGRPFARREDGRLLRGRGEFLGDIRSPGFLDLAVLRSPHAHARIRRVELDRAARFPGVVAVASAGTLAGRMRRLPMMAAHPALRAVMPYPLACGKALYAGQPVAVVVAENRYQAEDALDAISVAYDPLPTVVDPESALLPDTRLVTEELGSNLGATVTERVGDPEGAFRRAAVVVHRRLRIGRCAAVSMEGRGIAAQASGSGGELSLTVWAAHQTPHVLRALLADAFDLDDVQIRVIAPDIGGGFGAKARLYPEDYLVVWFGLELRSPIRWISDRAEDLLATCQARDQIHDAELALDENGRILAFRDHFVHDNGAFPAYGIVAPLQTVHTLAGQYRIPNMEVQFRCVYTNKAPTAPYRGAGRPEAAFVMERLIDRAANTLHLDPAELRRRNLIQPDEFPYSVGLSDRNDEPIIYDSGNYPALLDRALALSDYSALRQRQAELRAGGRFLGIGIATNVERSGVGPFEGATVRVSSSGKVMVYSGASSQGQGIETSLAQVCAERLGVPFQSIRVVTGDTALAPLGVGTFASRVAVMAGNAVSRAATQVRTKALELAAEQLEVDADDLELASGEITVKGVPGTRMTMKQLARLANAAVPGTARRIDLTPGLEATAFFQTAQPTHSSGTHVASVEVDVATGEVFVLSYVVVHDCGRIINPLILDGQIHGGVAQGIGNALLEEIRYDEAGQPLTATLVDYLLPTAMSLPELKIGHVETPSPLNPEGLKGAGEGGTIPAPAAIVSAIEDALAPFDITIDECPVGPERIREIIRAAQLRKRL